MHWRIQGAAPKGLNSFILRQKFSKPLADLGGRARRAPPYGSRFFHFDMQNFQNLAALGVHGPHYEVHTPLQEILDLPLKM